MPSYLLYFFAWVILSLSSCANMNPSNHTEFTTSELPESSAQETNNEYLLESGDVMDIKFYYNPELNESVPIRPDGNISLQLVGEIAAAQLTPAELTKVLVEKYKKLLLNPEIIVIVKGFGGHNVYTGGEVIAPGEIPLVGNMTALQAILKAGGFTETAHRGSVIVISKGPEGVPISRKVDLDAVISGDDHGKDVFLNPFDVVYVPKTFIAKANKFVEQYIQNMIPVTLSAGYSYTRYKGKQSGTVRTVPVQ